MSERQKDQAFRTVIRLDTAFVEAFQVAAEDPHALFKGINPSLIAEAVERAKILWGEHFPDVERAHAKYFALDLSGQIEYRLALANAIDTVLPPLASIYPINKALFFAIANTFTCNARSISVPEQDSTLILIDAGLFGIMQKVFLYIAHALRFDVVTETPFTISIAPQIVVDDLQWVEGAARHLVNAIKSPSIYVVIDLEEDLHILRSGEYSAYRQIAGVMMKSVECFVVAHEYVHQFLSDPAAITNSDFLLPEQGWAEELYCDVAAARIVTSLLSDERGGIPIVSVAIVIFLETLRVFQDAISILKHGEVRGLLHPTHPPFSLRRQAIIEDRLTLRPGRLRETPAILRDAYSRADEFGRSYYEHALAFALRRAAEFQELRGAARSIIDPQWEPHFSFVS